MSSVNEGRALKCEAVYFFPHTSAAVAERLSLGVDTGAVAESMPHMSCVLIMDRRCECRPGATAMGVTRAKHATCEEVGGGTALPSVAGDVTVGV